LAIGEAIISSSTVVTVVTRIVTFAGTLSSSDLTDLSCCSIDIASARNTPRVAKVALVAPVTVLPSIFGAAKTTSTACLTLSCRICQVTSAFLTGIRRINGNIGCLEEPWFALLTVDTSSVVLTILTNSSSLKFAVDVHGLPLRSNCFIVHTLGGMTVTVARFTSIYVIHRGRFPWFLNEPITTAFTLGTASVVLTSAKELVGISRISKVTISSMSITHTSASQRDVLDTVEVPSRDCRVLSSNGHEMTQESFGPQQS